MQIPTPKTRPDTLRWAVFLALLGSTQVEAQGALTPTPGPGGTPIIDNGHGVPVIDIVAPNAGGLSHNQFLDYNVGKQGLVLNNALQAGQSQLAGQLGANPQFQGQAASTILNEVVSQNASRIEGAQEIFGQKADYLLANPNGITLNGGSFINTTRAGFLVGNVDIQDGQLKHLDSREASATLQVLGGGQSNARGALDLIAPRIDSKGPLLAQGQLNLTVGRNRIDAGNREVLEHLPAASASIDAKLLGAMQGGRIRIVSTAEGAGVQVGDASLLADRDLIIHSAGDLHVQGSDRRQASLTSNTGKLDLNAAGDLRLTATQGKARQIEVNAGKKLTLDTVTREKVLDDPTSWKKEWAFITTEAFDGNTKTTRREQLGSRLRAEDSINLQAGSDLHLTAVQLNADNGLKLRSGGTMTIDAGVDSEQVDERLNHRVYLNNTGIDSKSYSEKVKSSTLKADTLVASAGGDLQLRAARLEAEKTIALDANGDLTIESAEENARTERSTGKRHFTASAGRTQPGQDGQPSSGQYTASVGYEALHSDEQTSATRQVASNISGAAVTVRTGQKLTVSGSEIKANAGSLEVSASEIELAAAHDSVARQTIDTRTGAALAVTGGMDRLGLGIDAYRGPAGLIERENNVRRSTLQASGDLRLDTRQLTTEAANVQASRTLHVNAERIDNRAVANIRETETSLNQWDGSLGISTDYQRITRPIERLFTGKQAESARPSTVIDKLALPKTGAELAIGHQTRLQKDIDSTAQVSTFNGADVRVKADHIKDEGTDYNARTGSLRIEAGEHQALAANDRKTREVKYITGGGSLQVDTTLATDINARLEGKGSNLTQKEEASVARVGSLRGKSGIEVQLERAGHYQGTYIASEEGAVSLESSGDLTLAAAQDHTSSSSTKFEAGLAAKGGTGLLGPNGGLDGNLKHSTLTQHTEKARVAQIDGKGTIELSSTGDMHLQGTRIDSREGDIRLHSDGVLKVTAAHDTRKSEGKTWGGGLDVTGSATGGALGGHGTFGWVNEQASMAVGAQFTGKGAVQLTSLAREDVALQVQGLQASAERIGLDAQNGGLLIEAARNTEHHDNLAVTVGGGLKLAALDLGGINGQVDLKLDKRNNTTWHDSNLRADLVDLRSQGDTRVEGAQVQAKRIEGKVGGDLLVASRQDQVDSLVLDIDASLTQKASTQGTDESSSPLETLASGNLGEIAGALWSKITAKFTPSLKAEYAQRKNDTVNQQTTLSATHGIDLEVGGETRLVGATLRASEGQVELGESSVSRKTLNGRDHERKVKVDASFSPVDLAGTLFSFIKDKVTGNDGADNGDKPLDLGLVRTSGHDRSVEYVSKIEEGRRH
ncbi:hemagglutinin repeat-containing protein [Pseudomonas mosselii]|uniref:hemagglutinin repeat-containing protein n=1 Tax=unclassified Pseudomonas TaxID=196821 RepID=UPI0020C517EA|nr:MULTISPECIES: hemagglutinin repeat-containing protein [unclassified Pseudomonas]MCP8636200.1 hemagglutinin repeat-containing protein [Pseudomonas sp. DVZ6]MDD7786770.1 hemagglutinin repeat-containing protein [Pseudomonas sp. DVZ24]